MRRLRPILSLQNPSHHALCSKSLLSRGLEHFSVACCERGATCVVILGARALAHSGASSMGEAFDVLDEHGNKTGEVKDRKLVHQDGVVHRQHAPLLVQLHSWVSLAVNHSVCHRVRTLKSRAGMPARSRAQRARHDAGDWHRAVHVWLYAMDTQRLLIQKRVEFKDSWPGKWDISSAGHGALSSVGALCHIVRGLPFELLHNFAGVSLPTGC